MSIPRLLFAIAFLAFGPPLLAGGTWLFQVVHVAKATEANKDMIWKVKFDLPKDKAEVRYRVWVAGSQETGNQETDGQTQKKLPADGTVAIPKNGNVVFTYDRSRCAAWAVNKGIAFQVMDYQGRAAAYKLEKTGQVTYVDEKSRLAAKTKDVLILTQAAQSNTGFTTIGILKDAIRD
jgi:hypothetical protein